MINNSLDKKNALDESNGWQGLSNRRWRKIKLLDPI